MAHNYNVGSLAPGKRRTVARWAADAIDVFLVHSPSEFASYTEYFDLPQDRFRFVPLQRGRLEVERKEDTNSPYILAMGSAHRDYATLIRAADHLAVRTIIVARPDDIARLPRSLHVECRSGLSRIDCLKLLAGARLSVTPISNMATASGQITFINAMQLGVPVIATKCPGTEGYIDHQKTGVLVPAADAGALRDAIAALWTDPDRRESLAKAGLCHAEAYFSDEGAARVLEEVLLSLKPDDGRKTRIRR